MKARGFTLLEVLIALAIVAMSVGALLGTVTSSASNIIYLREKTEAEWVALNRLTEVRIAQQFPVIGKRTGKSELGGQRWQWEQEITELPVKGMFRIDVRVRPTGETVDDTRESEKVPTQKLDEGEPSGGETEKLNWSTTVTGVISSSRSDLRNPIGARLIGDAGQGGPGNNPNTPGGTPAPTAPGTTGTPGTGNPPTPRNPGDPGAGPKSPPPPSDR
jgi:general secretion pathway protein I